MTIRVLLCDKHPLVRTGLRATVDHEPDLQVVGDFADGNSAAAAVGSLSPTVVVADIAALSGPAGPGSGPLVDAATNHSVRVVVLADKPEIECASIAFRTGASGFLLKGEPPEQIVYGIRVAANGHALLSPAVTSRFVAEIDHHTARYQGRSPDPRAVLTSREVEVLRLLATGMAVPRIAERLFVAEVTVRSHIHHILRKLGLDRSFQAVALAYHTGLVRAPVHSS